MLLILDLFVVLVDVAPDFIHPPLEELPRIKCRLVLSATVENLPILSLMPLVVGIFDVAASVALVFIGAAHPIIAKLRQASEKRFSVGVPQ